ncbi:MAG: hypothetical protein IMZ55_09065 [Acidobacteria bacterium]|nr:hypothetical protein [Acidobacteriota bacterium]
MMWFATVVSLGALGMAIGFVVRPTEAKLALMRPLTLATIFAAICSFSAGIAAVLKGVAASGPNIGMSNVYMGLSETLVPLFVTNAFLAVAWLLVTAGLRRQQ